MLLMTIIFDGKKLAQEKEKALRAKVDELKKQGIIPQLVSILIGNNPASKLYLGLKQKAAERVGVEFEKKEFPENVSLQEVIAQIKKSNQDEKVWGIIVQLPFELCSQGKPFKEIEKQVLNTIDPKKDVDCLTKANLELLKQGKSRFLPATVRGIMEILQIGKVSLEGKKIVVVGAKGFVGRPLVNYLRSLGNNVVGVDKETPDLKTKTKEADILISATGVPNLIKKEMVKEGAVVIDVGSPKGDVCFEEVKEVASFITPVPGGVGPMTVICLFENLLLGLKYLSTG